MTKSRLRLSTGNGIFSQNFFFTKTLIKGLARG